MSRSTASSLVCADQCPSPKSRVRRSAAATRTATSAAASLAVTGVNCRSAVYLNRRRRVPGSAFQDLVLEHVRVLLAFDDDVHPAGEAGEVAGRGIGDDRDGEAGRAAVHDAGLLQRAAALLAVQRAADPLDRGVR